MKGSERHAFGEPARRTPWTDALVRLLVVCLGTFLVALAVRWSTPDGGAGAAFLPRPDALEYLAGAQAIAQTGDYFLQVGPLRARPRYPPGLSLLQALGLRAGIDPSRLVAAHEVLGALTASLIALLAGLWAAALAPSGAPRRRATPAAGALAGLVWAVAPIALRTSQLTMSDEPTVFLSLLALGAIGIAARTSSGRRERGLAFAGGALCVVAASLRVVAAPLLAGPALMLALGGAWDRDARRRALRLAGWAALGGVLPFAAICALQLRWGWPAWPWSGYAWWAPDAYGPDGGAFSAAHLLEWRARYGASDPERLSNGGLLLTALLGLPIGPPRGALGLVWPSALWAALPLLTRWTRARGDATIRMWRAGLSSLAVWVLGHALLFGSYTFATPRFFVGPLAATTILAGVVLGLGFGLAPSRRRRAAAAVAGLAVVALSLVPNLRLWPLLRRPAPDPRPTVAAAVDAWLALAPEVRARSRVPFDPLEAQALGLLPPERIDAIREWGELPPTVQVLALRQRGRL